MTTSPNLGPTCRLVLCAETAADLMTPNPVSLNADATFKTAAAFLTDQGVSAAPVIDEAGRPVGVLSLSDLVVHDREDFLRVSARPEFYQRADLSPRAVRIISTDVVDGETTRVSDLMTPAVFSATLETPAYRVIEDMLALNVHRLFVVDCDGILVGVVSTVDVLRHLRQEPPPEEMPAPAQESSPPDPE